MAHPADVFVRKAGKKRACGIKVHEGLAILAFGRLSDFPAQLKTHELGPVANTENRNAPGLDFWVNDGGVF